MGTRSAIFRLAEAAQSALDSIGLTSMSLGAPFFGAKDLVFPSSGDTVVHYRKLNSTNRCLGLNADC